MTQQRNAGPLQVGLVTGSPLAVLVVWALETYVFEQSLPAMVAGAVGALATTAAGAVSVAWRRLFSGGKGDVEGG